MLIKISVIVSNDEEFVIMFQDILKINPQLISLWTACLVP